MTLLVPRSTTEEDFFCVSLFPLTGGRPPAELFKEERVTPGRSTEASATAFQSIHVREYRLCQCCTSFPSKVLEPFPSGPKKSWLEIMMRPRRHLVSRTFIRFINWINPGRFERTRDTMTYSASFPVVDTINVGLIPEQKDHTLKTVNVVYSIARKVFGLQLPMYFCALSVVGSDNTEFKFAVVMFHEMNNGINFAQILPRTIRYSNLRGRVGRHTLVLVPALSSPVRGTSMKARQVGLSIQCFDKRRPS